LSQPPSWPQSGGGWYAAPGGWAPPPGFPPAPPRRRRAVVAWTVAGVAVAIAVLVLVVLAGLRLGGDAEWFATSGPAAATTSPADPSALGDDPGLDSYAQRCHDGDMEACDDLAGLGDVMSDYEQYGMTCGGRVKARAVWTCNQLD
jgi:hypothetical protein